MATKGRNYPGQRMIHIRITEEMHKRLRIRAAELDITMQDVVTKAIAKELGKGKKT